MHEVLFHFSMQAFGFEASDDNPAPSQLPWPFHLKIESDEISSNH
jgi:hypothetical protein